MIVKLEVYNDGECWCARGIGVDILTCAHTLDELMDGIRDAVACHYDDGLKQGGSVDILTIIETTVTDDTAAAAG